MEKKKKGKKLIILFIIIAVVIIAAAVGIKKNSNKNDSPTGMLVQMQAVEKRDLSETITLTGSVSGQNVINYTSDAQSTFLTVNVEVGDEVKKGDVLATLDKAEIQKQISALEKTIASNNMIIKNQSEMNKEALDSAKTEQTEQLAAAQKLIDAAKVELAAAKAELATLDSQLAADPSLKDDFDFMEEYDSVSKDVKEAASYYDECERSYHAVKKSTDLAIKNAQNTIDMEKYTDNGSETYTEQLFALQEQLEACEIICEEDGIVIAVNAYKGAQNAPGSPVIVVENNQSMVMTASVDETDILKLQEGMNVIVTAKALGEQEIKGTVTKVLRVASGTTNAGSMEGMSQGATMSGFSVQIQLEDSPLISGMSAKAKVLLSNKQGVLSVPYDLVQYDENNETFILVGEENEDGSFTAVKKHITVGKEMDYYTEVTGGDLQEGDLVIMDNMIFEGMVFEGAYSMDSEME